MSGGAGPAGIINAAGEQNQIPPTELARLLNQREAAHKIHSERRNRPKPVGWQNQPYFNEITPSYTQQVRADSGARWPARLAEMEAQVKRVAEGERQFAEERRQAEIFKQKVYQARRFAAQQSTPFPESIPD